MPATPPYTVDADRLRAAMRLPAFDGRAAQRAMEPVRRGPRPPGSEQRPARPAAALAYLYAAASGELQLPLTVRRTDLPEHRGQVSLPGGRPQDGEDLWRTAVREAREEIGLAIGPFERLGSLAPVYIPVTHTALVVYVVLGPPPPPLVPCPREVERIEVVEVAGLVDPARRASRVLAVAGEDVEVPYFDVAGLFLWGATAMALSELAERLLAVRT